MLFNIRHIFHFFVEYLTFFSALLFLILYIQELIENVEFNLCYDCLTLYLYLFCDPALKSVILFAIPLSGIKIL